MHSEESSAELYDEASTGLNPCFSGRCTRSVFTTAYAVVGWVVLILVLVEDALGEVKRVHLRNVHYIRQLFNAILFEMFTI